MLICVFNYFKAKKVAFYFFKKSKKDKRREAAMYNKKQLKERIKFIPFSKLCQCQFVTLLSLSDAYSFLFPSFFIEYYKKFVKKNVQL